MSKREAEREALWNELERELRRFARVYAEQPEWLWEASTVQLMRIVRPALNRLADSKERGGRVE
jgi:hypothetical protein